MKWGREFLDMWVQRGILPTLWGSSTSQISGILQPGLERKRESKTVSGESMSHNSSCKSLLICHTHTHTHTSKDLQVSRLNVDGSEVPCSPGAPRVLQDKEVHPELHQVPLHRLPRHAAVHGVHQLRSLPINTKNTWNLTNLSSTAANVHADICY